MTAPQDQPGVQPQSDTELDLHYYAGLLYKGRWLILVCALVAASLGVVIGLLQVPVYRTSALIKLDPPAPPFMDVNQAAMFGAGNYWANLGFYNTEYQILRSKPVARGVVERLKLADRPPFKGHPDPAALILGRLSVDPVPETQLVRLTISHESPGEAALWVNTLADVYIEQSLQNRLENTRRAYTWLQDRIETTQDDMRSSQRELFETYRNQDVFVPDGSVSMVTGSISRLNQDYVDAQARRIAIEAAVEQASEFLAQGQPLDSIPQVGQDAAVSSFNSRLAELELELSRLKERFRDGHPEVQKVFTQQESVREAKQRRAEQIVEGLRVEHQQLRKRESELRQAVNARMEQAASQSQRGAELELLKKESESARGLYDVLLQKLNESDIASSISSNNITLVEHAVPPSSPVSPNKTRIAGTGLLIGLVLGVGLVFGRDYLDNTIKGPEDIERYLHLELLAAVPRYADADTHLVTEAYQNLRTSLIFSRQEERGQVVLVAGTLPQEGKTTTLVNLARLLATAGDRTLAIDFDLRRANLHRQLGLPREPGVTDAFIARSAVDELIRPTDVENLWALTAGPLPPNPPALLARKRLRELLDELCERYDWVLLDSPPLASVTDALLLARQADTTIMVVQHNKADKKLIRRTVTSLRKAGANVLGAVLNVVDLSKAHGYYYYYYQQDGEAKDKKAKSADAAASSA
jgi:capsular exopolysaccharide synthesis family protein